MTKRIVVGFLLHSEPETSEAEISTHLDRVDALMKRAEALGGTLCAFGVEGLAFDFAPDDVEEAIALSVSDSEGDASNEDRVATSSAWSVGVAIGALERLIESGSRALPAWGEALRMASVLARAARAGETLVHPDVPGVERGELLTHRARLVKMGRQKFRGLVLDRRQVWRKEAAESVCALVRPALVGRSAVVSDLLASHTPLGLLRADPGYGGTRVLEEIELALTPARSLLLGPAGAEPLGSLRRAFQRAVARHDTASFRIAMGTELCSSFDALLHGAGVPAPVATDLVLRWIDSSGVAMSGRPRIGALLVDDAEQVDESSLEVLASTIAGKPGLLRTILRVDSLAIVPEPLAHFEIHPEVRLAPLPRLSAEELARAWCAGQLSAEGAKRWARCGRFIPLGIAEALAEGLTSGELAWVESVAGPRYRGAGLRASCEPAEWLSRRLARLEAGKLDLLRAAALLGVLVRAAPLLDVVRRVRPASSDWERDLQALVGEKWLKLEADGLYTLSSRTLIDAVIKGIPSAEAPSWHGAVCGAIEEHDGALGHAEAARHAALAGDSQRAVRMALAAAQACQSLGFRTAERQLSAFIELARRDSSPPTARRPSSPQLVLGQPESLLGAACPPCAAPAFATDAGRPQLMHSAPEPPQPSLPVLSTAQRRPPSQQPAGGAGERRPSDQAVNGASPRRGPSDQPVAGGAARLPSGQPVAGERRPPSGQHPVAAKQLPSSEPAVRESRPPSGQHPVAAKQLPSSEPAVRESRLPSSTPHPTPPPPSADTPGSDPPSSAPSCQSGGTAEDRDEGPLSLTRVLRLDSWADALRSSESEPLPTRVEAITALARGPNPKAIRILTMAAKATEGGPAGIRSRALLALAIGLAAAGRQREALVEALRALACARHAAEIRGELACAQFLSRLSAAAGATDAAQRWQEVAIAAVAAEGALPSQD